MTTDLDRMKIRILSLLNQLDGVASQDCLEKANEWIEIGEWKLAIEFICECLYEEEIVVPNTQHTTLIGLCIDLHLDSRYWKRLPSCED